MRREWEQETCNIVPRFRIQPTFAGYGGHRNMDYRGPACRRKEVIRSIGRRFVPWLWL
jgi:hypothetical protein